MSDQTTDKGDAAAQKAYESAVAAKSDSERKPAAEPAKAAETPAPDVTVKQPAKKATTKPATAKKAAPVDKSAPAKPSVKAPVAKKKAQPAKRKQATPTKSKAAAKTAASPKTKDTTMATKTETKTPNFAPNFANDMAAEMQTRLAGMYEKSTEMTGEMVTFQRANAEAMTEAGKILFTGMQDMTRGAVEETRKAADQMSEDARLMAAAKSPTELVKLQGDIMRRSFDHAVATGSKNTEAWIKLTNDAFAPLTSRVSEAVDKMNKIAA
jgi:phasin family protein|tara:strand:+ start:950 stop:1753 length:804 start_codon:yes stop_codon:yes gene_type:complete